MILSLGWTLNVPGIVHLLRSRPLRPLASLSFNRWVFATSDAILILAAIGLDSLLASVPRFRRWWIIPMLAAVGYCGWCVYRLFTLTHDLDNQGFSRCFLLGIALCLAALIGWTTTFRSGSYAKWIRVGVICLLPAELFWFAWSERRQADMALYFPPVPILDKLAASATGRIWGIDCLPPNLNQVVGLEDIRGYDGVDPRNSVKLLDLAINHRFKQTLLAYARTQIAIPVLRWTDRGLKCHSVVDLLNVCYLVYREQPPNGLDVIMHEDDYWIVANRTALPRAFVPRSVRVVKEDAQALAALEHFDLDPRQTAFMTDALPPARRHAGGSNRPLREPDADNSRSEHEDRRPGAALRFVGSRLRTQLDGTPCPIHRVDVALRGFLVSAGKHQIVCTYDPQIVHIGFLAGAVGCILLVLWTLWKVVARLRPRAGTASVGLPAPS